MRRTLKSVTALMVLALCIAGAHPPSVLSRALAGQAVTPSSGDNAQPNLKGTVRSLGVPAYEPTLAISDEGDIFFAAGLPSTGIYAPFFGAEYRAGQMWVYASADQGLSWENVTPSFPVIDNSEAIDPYLTIDRDTGRIFRASYQIDDSRCMDLIWSDDNGKSWTHQPVACGQPQWGTDHESLATAKPRTPVPTAGYPNLLYLCANRIEGSSCATSRDGGLSFGVFHNVYPTVKPGDGWCGGLHNEVVTDSEGRVFVPREYCGAATVAVSEDDGTTWERRLISDMLLPRGDFLEAQGLSVPYVDVPTVRIAVDEDDNLHAIWVDGDYTLWYAFSRDHGKTWSEERRISAPDVTKVGPVLTAVTAGASGQVAFTYVGSEHESDKEDDADATWNVYLGVMTNAFSESRVLTTALNDADDPVGLGNCGVTRCTIDDLGVAEGMYDYMDVDLDAEGRPWVAFVDVCHQECNDTGHHDVAEASVGTLTHGPALTKMGGMLPPLRSGTTVPPDCSEGPSRASGRIC